MSKQKVSQDKSQSAKNGHRHELEKDAEVPAPDKKLKDVQEDQKRAGPYDLPGRRPS